MGNRASGGAHTSRTMLLADLSTVLAACPANSSHEDYRTAIIDSNVAGKDTLSSRQRTFRYLREMYLLDPEDASFRAMLRLWHRDALGQPMIALLMASSHDYALAATSSGVLSLKAGEIATSVILATAVDREFPGNYSDSIRDKIGRNSLSSWTQAGYLKRTGRGPAIRQSVDPTAGATAMALALGFVDGVSGELLFTTTHAALLDASVATLHDRAHEAARKGWLNYRSSGMVTEVELDALLAEPEDQRLPLAEGVST